MATNYVKASYTEIIDLQTINGTTSIVGLHTPVGSSPYQRLKGFFDQFRKFRYKGISSLVMVPAAQLPVDPLGLTGVTGTTDLMDPRDQLNPILFHGCHGENLGSILDSIYSASEYMRNPTTGSQDTISQVGKNVSDSAVESKFENTNLAYYGYYKCLTDVSWKKYGIQSGVRLKHLHPLVWKVAQNHPLVPTLQEGNIGELVSTQTAYDTPSEIATKSTASSLNNAGFVYGGISQQVMAGVTDFTITRPVYQQQFTNGCASLGWLPTTQIGSDGKNYQVTLPKLYMGLLVLPPAYNVEQFFRCAIRHEFEFRDFTSSLGNMGLGANALGVNPIAHSYFNWIDYSTSAKAVSEASVPMSCGETIDVIGGSSQIVSDGVS